MKQAPTFATDYTKNALLPTNPNVSSNMSLIARIVLLALLWVGTCPTFAQQQKIDSLLKVLQTTKADTSKVKLLHRISIEYLNTLPDRTIEYAKQGLTLSEKIEYKNGQSICLKALGWAYKNTGKYDSALVCFEKRLTLVKELKDSIEIAKTFGNIGNIYLYYGNNKKAIALFEKAVRIFTSYNDKISLATGYNSLGAIYMNQAEYPIALEYYLKACKIYEKEKNESDILLPLINISGIYTELKQYDNAKRYALEAKSKAAKTNNRERLGGALYNLSAIYSAEGDFKNTIKYLNEAKAIFDKLQSLYGQTLVNELLGKTYDDHGEHEKAFSYFNTLLFLAQKLGNRSLIATSFINISDIYLQKNDYLRALECLHTAEANLKEINDKIQLLNVFKGFTILYAHMNQPENVEKCFKQYQDLSDTIYHEKVSKSIAEVQTKYETEKKDKEILALNLDAEKKKNTVWAVSSGAVLLLVVSGSGFAVFSNKKRREQAVLLQTISETDMKALRSQMNPHFIFNCIHTINRLLSELKIQESKACLDQFSNLTRSVLENSKKREIPLSNELETLRLYMDLENIRFASPFRYSFAIEPGIDPETTLIPPLILQPFVENAIKHGFRDPEKPGQLNIAIRAENGSLVCTVEDNGIGRANTVNIHPVSGFKKESLGIKLTEERLELISRTKKVNSWFSINDLFDEANNPAGTLVEMVLPYELSV